MKQRSGVGKRPSFVQKAAHELISNRDLAGCPFRKTTERMFLINIVQECLRCHSVRGFRPGFGAAGFMAHLAQLGATNTHERGMHGTDVCWLWRRLCEAVVAVARPLQKPVFV